ncbi:unnamed protein product [Nezara viridula]|uniref:KANL2-like probable zinc-finger domain-containing protein n=1 Tax=Nezara viridula TaxID=85310 RepID=A0A9P0HFM1_NEZVI|nr:unnamed protein product [Nezara viridula]
MQDAFVRDMFSLSDVNNSRYNGHVQLSSCGKSTGGKRDRKGCTKGKIEAIMKNNSVRPKVCISASVKKPVSTVNNHSLFSNHSVKAEQEEDPYTFTEPEPQALSLYQPSGSSNKKPSQLRPSPTTMVCQEKNKVEHGKTLLKVVKTPEGTSKMNKLQADIARNKVIGKRRKINEQSSPKVNEWAIKREPGKVCISAKRKSIWQRERNSKHELLERIHQVQNNLNQFTRDLYPLEPVVKPLNDTLFTGSQWVFQQVSAPAHKAMSTHQWQQKNILEFISASDWPLGRPHPNPLNYRLWSKLEMMACRRAHHNLESLKQSLVRAVERFPQEVLGAAIDDWPRRLNACLEVSDSDSDSEPGMAVYERSWFCSSGEGLPRERRVEEARASLRRRLHHTVRALRLTELPPKNLYTAVIAAARRFPSATAAILDPTLSLKPHLPINRGSMFLLRGEKCSYPEGCEGQALPCTRHCLRHIMYNVDQRLFSHCTAKYPDNTQCTTPVFDVLHHLPLCHRHASSVTYETQNRLSDSRSGKKVSKKSRILGSSKRNNKKRKKLGISPSAPRQSNDVTSTSSPIPASVPETILESETSTIVPQPHDKNGEYEPTREETEELERALEAVNNDVRSLETLSRSLPLLQLPLDTMALLDDPTPFTSFHNGFPPPQTHQS